MYKDPHTGMFTAAVHNSLELETTQVSISSRTMNCRLLIEEYQRAMKINDLDLHTTQMYTQIE